MSLLSTNLNITSLQFKDYARNSTARSNGDSCLFNKNGMSLSIIFF